MCGACLDNLLQHFASRNREIGGNLEFCVVAFYLCLAVMILYTLNKARKGKKYFGTYTYFGVWILIMVFETLDVLPQGHPLKKIALVFGAFLIGGWIVLLIKRSMTASNTFSPFTCTFCGQRIRPHDEKCSHCGRNIMFYNRNPRLVQTKPVKKSISNRVAAILAALTLVILGAMAISTIPAIQAAEYQEAAKELLKTDHNHYKSYKYHGKYYIYDAATERVETIEKEEFSRNDGYYLQDHRFYYRSSDQFSSIWYIYQEEDMTWKKTDHLTWWKKNDNPTRDPTWDEVPETYLGKKWDASWNVTAFSQSVN